MRPFCSSCQLTVVFVGGVVLVAVAVVAKFFFDAYIVRQLHLQLPLSPNSSSFAGEVTSFKVWKDIPFPIKNKFYFFHVENPLEVSRYGERPFLTQKGPYVYDQWKHKVDIRFSANRSTVSYRELSFFHFSHESVDSDKISSLSETKSSSLYGVNHRNFLADVTPADGNLDRESAVKKNPGNRNTVKRNNAEANLPSTKVRVLNVPLLAILNRAKSLPLSARVGLDLLIAETGSKLFVERTVEELLWGYDDPLLVKLKHLVPGAIPFTRFGWFMDQNGTDQGRFRVYTGLDGDLMRYLNIFSWKGRRRLNLWPPGRESHCNSFEGATDGSAFGPDLVSTNKLRTFAPRMCRGAFDSIFLKKERRRGVDMLRFQMDDQTFANASVNPANSCFCSTSALNSSCPPSGTLNISACSFGAPVFLSQPHFLNADPGLATRFKGLSPSVANHGSFFYIESTSGINTEAKGRLQLNGFVKNLKSFPLVFDKIEDDLVFPVVWVEEEATMDDRTFSTVIKRRVVDQIRLTSAAVALLSALAVFCLLSAFLLAVQRWRFKRGTNIARERLVPVDFPEISSE